MVKVIFIILALFSTNICRADNPPKVLLDGKEITVDEFPIFNGSPCTRPLRFILACKLLGFNYKWYYDWRQRGTSDSYKKVDIYTSNLGFVNNSELTEKEAYFRSLHQSDLLWDSPKPYINLIDNKVELILMDNEMSFEDKEYADEKGVTLLSKPIARNALTFMINSENPVDNLSTQQIQGIYTGDITNWNEVGGEDIEIKAYVRNSSTFEQKEFETKVMDGLTVSSFPILNISGNQVVSYYQIITDKKAISYTPYYYHSVINGPSSTKAVGVDGVAMTRENILNGTYPYVTNVYASVRSDIDKSSVAYKIYEFLTTDEGQSIVDESGYIPLPKAASISNMSKVNADITIRDHTINIVSEKPAQRIEVADLQGRTIYQNTTTANKVSVQSDMHGVYMVSVWFAGGEKLTKKICMK
ncbi:MAG: substrate-binding domain-containing protein [Bacteroidaceae bacterium]|nr:substrate-binding domain-containing protein [Bacteroidaceae bacterium]